VTGWFSRGVFLCEQKIVFVCKHFFILSMSWCIRVFFSFCFYIVVVLTHGSILSRFLMTGGFCRGVYVVKRELPVGVKNVVALRRVVGYFFNGVRLVQYYKVLVCVCSHYPVLRMAQYKESSRFRSSMFFHQALCEQVLMYNPRTVTENRAFRCNVR
jgi:hypothetical protein